MDAIADWDPKREALFYVIDREAGDIVAKYKVRFFIKTRPDDQLIRIRR